MRRCAVYLCFSGALGLYAISFFLPVDAAHNGWSAMLICLNIPFEGEMNPLDGERGLFRFLCFGASLANVTALLGFGNWLARKWRLAFWAGFASLALAVPVQIMAVYDSMNPANELLGSGYWVWLNSFVVLVVANCAGMACDQGSTFTTGRSAIQLEP